MKTVLIDERDTYLAERIRASSGERLVAVVGAGHVPGIQRALAGAGGVPLSPLESVPPPSAVWRWVGWGVPALIVSALVVIGLRQGAEAAQQNALYWILANGIPSMIGAIASLAHPATVVAAFVAAPITSLTPLIGAGYVAAFVQAYVSPPRVRELAQVATEIRRPRQWWRNRLLRVFLVFLLTSLGSALGTFVGGYEIISNLR